MARRFKHGDPVQWWEKEGLSYSSEVSGTIRARGIYQRRVGAHALITRGQMTTHVPVSFLTLDEFTAVVNLGKAAIRRDVEAGRVPPTASSFAQLHDYVDANGYGGAFLNGAHPVEDTDFWNRVQDELDKWIKSGGDALFELRFKEHGAIVFPRWLQRLGFEDRSYRNDFAGAATRPVDEDRDLTVWVYHADPEEREQPTDPQFSVVSVRAGTADVVSDLYTGEYASDALDAIKEYIGEKCREDLGRVIEMVAALERNTGHAFDFDPPLSRTFAEITAALGSIQTAIQGAHNANTAKTV